MDDTPPDEPEGDGLVCVFVAVTMAEARAAEDVFRRFGIEFQVEVQTVASTILGSDRNGAMFCVAPDKEADCAALLRRNGLGIGVVQGDEGV